MALTVEIEFKQNYDLQHAYVKDNIIYDPLDRTSVVTSFTIEMWDWELGVDPAALRIITNR